MGGGGVEVGTRRGVVRVKWGVLELGGEKETINEERHL